MTKSELIYEPNDSLQTVDFFIPLPSAITLPDNYQVNFEEVDDRSDVSCIRFTNRDGLARRIKTRVTFHRIATTVDLRPIDASFQAMKSFYGDEDNENNRSLNKDAYSTVAHMGVITDRQELDVDSRTMMFDVALSQLRVYLKSYYAITRQPIELPSRENLAMIVASSNEEVDCMGLPVDDRASLERSAFMLNANIDGFISREDRLDQTLLSLIEDSNIQQDTDMMTTYLDTYREAVTADTRGALISAAILFAASAEIILDLALEMMVWEEGCNPGVAASLLYETKTCGCEECGEKIRTTLQRVTVGMYADRVGGDWSIKNATIKDWRKLAELRNKVVHTGYEPNDSDIKFARKTTDAILTFVIDRLCTNIKVYPMSANMLAGTRGLETRGKTSEYNLVMNDGALRSMLPSKTFTAWKFELDRTNGLHPKKSKDVNCHFGYYLHQDGSEHWILYDENERLFRFLSDQQLEQNAQKMLSEIKNQWTTAGKQKSVIVKLIDQSPNKNGRNIKWYPMYLLSSDFAINPFPISYLSNQPL